MPTVAFIEIGRGKQSWTALLPDTETWTIAAEASRALASRGVDAQDGIIYVGGCRPVGRYQILIQDLEDKR